MSASSMLTGIELIDCARANAKQGVEVAARQCGYGTDLNRFSQALQEACHHIGVEIHELSDLITDSQSLLRQGGVEFAPDNDGDL
jgi:hypothetical protein